MVTQPQSIHQFHSDFRMLHFKTVVVVVCITCWSSASSIYSNGRKMYFFKDLMNFYEAFTLCESLNLQLLWPNSNDELMAIRDRLDSNGAWTSSYQVSDGEWYNLSTGEKLGILQTSENKCINLPPPTEALNYLTADCETKAHVICESKKDTKLEDIEALCEMDTEPSAYLMCKKTVLCGGV